MRRLIPRPNLQASLRPHPAAAAALLPEVMLP